MKRQNYFTPLVAAGVLASSLAAISPHPAYAQSSETSPQRLIALAQQCTPDDHIGNITRDYIEDRLHKIKENSRDRLDNDDTFGENNRIGSIYLDHLRLSPDNQYCQELGSTIAHMQGFTNDRNSEIYRILGDCNPVTDDEKWAVRTLKDEFTQYGTTSFFHPSINDHLFESAGCDVESLEARIRQRTDGDVDLFGFRSN